MAHAHKQVRALVSLSRTQSRLAQQYKAEGRQDEHARLRKESLWHMRFAYRMRDDFYTTPEGNEHADAA